jgi:2-(1,2-epoxy-1,2-dihydrophenyl)acetyl-CoA isomerase
MSTDIRPVLLRLDSTVATIELNRPDRRNALSPELAKAFDEAVEQVDSRSDIEVVVLRAAGEHFCVGGDLKALTASADLPGTLGIMADHMHAAIARLASMPKAVVAVARGTTAGGGLGLLLAADIVIASEESSFVAGYPGIGLTPDCGVSALLGRMVGLRRALRFTLGNEPLNAREASDWGIVTTVVPADGVEQELLRVLGRIGHSGPAAGRTRLLVRRGMTSEVEAHLAAEALSIVEFSMSNHTQAAIAAFGTRAGETPSGKEQ